MKFIIKLRIFHEVSVFYELVYIQDMKEILIFPKQNLCVAF